MLLLAVVLALDVWIAWRDRRLKRPTEAEYDALWGQLDEHVRVTYGDDGGEHGR